MSSLKNPFGEKNGKLILISDISPKENGKNVVAFAHFAREIFRQKQWEDSTTTFCASWKAV